MKSFTKGVVVTAIGVLICRECYVKGYNDALKKIDSVIEFGKSVLEGAKKES